MLLKKQHLIVAAAIFLGICTSFFTCSKGGGSNDAAQISTNSGGANGTGGSTARFTVYGTYLYTVDNRDLKVYDLANASAPVFKTTVPVGFEIETIFPFNNRLFIGSTTAVHIFDISNPAQPTRLSQAISPQVLRRCDPVVAKDTVAFATLRTNGECGGNQSILAVYDIKNISQPVQRAFLNVDEPYGLGYADTVLYVCDKFSGLRLISIAKPYQPRQFKNVTLSGTHFMDVIPYGDLLIAKTGRGMALYNIAQPADPQLIKEIL